MKTNPTVKYFSNFNQLFVGDRHQLHMTQKFELEIRVNDRTTVLAVMLDFLIPANMQTSIRSDFLLMSVRNYAGFAGAI